MKDAPGVVSLEAAERQFDRIQAFFPRIDAKVSSIFAIASGQIAVASFVSLKNLQRWWMLAPGALFLAAMAWSVAIRRVVVSEFCRTTALTWASTFSSSSAVTGLG